MALGQRGNSLFFGLDYHYWHFYLIWVLLLILGRCLLIYMGWVEYCLQVLVCPTIKNTSYFGCCAGLVEELKVCFDLVAHFPPGSIDDVITTQDRYFFILKIARQVCMPPVMWYIGGMNALGMGDKVNSVQSLTSEFNLCTRRTSYNFKWTV